MQSFCGPTPGSLGTRLAAKEERRVGKEEMVSYVRGCACRLSFWDDNLRPKYSHRYVLCQL